MNSKLSEMLVEVKKLKINQPEYIIKAIDASYTYEMDPDIYNLIALVNDADKIYTTYSRSKC